MRRGSIADELGFPKRVPELQGFKNLSLENQDSKMDRLNQRRAIGTDAVIRGLPPIQIAALNRHYKISMAWAWTQERLESEVLGAKDFIGPILRRKGILDGLL